MSRIVSVDGSPKTIPQHLVSSLMFRCDATGNLLPPKVIELGDRVRLLTRPFTDFVTTVKNIDVEQRMWIFFDLMGRKKRG